MGRMVNWLQGHEQRVFYFINQTIQHRVLDRLLSTLTHLGGATITILASTLLLLFGTSDWREVGLRCITALVLSHIPVAIIKKAYPRLRPYIVFPETNTCSNLLTDHSFPSGHTTAIFSIVTPIILYLPIIGSVLLPIAFIVGFSRIYLGLHYPSDVMVGAMIGTISAVISVALIG